MSKTLKCGDLMPGCDFVAHGESEEEVLQKAAAHAKESHGIEEITDELVAQVRANISDA
jgi:predicted small metal-binding protein